MDNINKKHTTRLSHSQANLYMECGKKYQFQYIDRLRQKEIPGHFVFGTAIDKACEAMLLGQDYRSKFIEMMESQEINNNPTQIRDSELIVYSTADYDEDLLNNEDLEDINLIDLHFAMDKRESVGFDLLSLEEKKTINRASWTCLRNKGLLTLEMVKEEILPNITEVMGTQLKSELANEDGDSILMFADFVGRWKNIKEPIVFDFKTSSKEYDQTSVITSPQLSLYLHALSDQYESTRKAGFIVLLKNPDKKVTKICTKCDKDGSGKTHRTCDAIVEDTRCHGEWKITKKISIKHQVIINDIPEQTESIVLDNFDSINKSIKLGIFNRNFHSCKKQFGKKIIPCPYIDKCYKNSNKGLIKVDEKKSKDS